MHSYNPETTEQENNVTIPATSNTGHASLESASSRKQKTVIVDSTPEAGITDTANYNKRCWEIS